MTDFHAFEKGGEDFLYFPRTARLYQLSQQAARVLSEVSNPGAGFAAVTAPLPLPGEKPTLSAELNALVQREMEAAPPVPSPE